MTTSVVIPNWRGKELLQKNLPSVLKVGFDEIIVVDDASPDDSCQFLKSKYPKVKVINHAKNLGFAHSVNSGVSAADGDIIFLLNLDVSPSKEILEPVVAHFKRDDSVFGVSLHEEGYGWSLPEIKDGFIAHKPGKETSISHKTFWISGGSGAFRKIYWDKLKGMDTMLSPFYWEDLELSYRALKRGWKLIWEPKARVIHEHESTINPKYFNPKIINWIKDRNQLLVAWKHLTVKELLLSHLPGLLKRLGKPGYWIVLFLAFLRLPQVLKGRIIEWREAKLSNEEVVTSFSETE